MGRPLETRNKLRDLPFDSRFLDTHARCLTCAYLCDVPERPQTKQCRRPPAMLMSRVQSTYWVCDGYRTRPKADA